jgi:hypothetical protein
MDRFSMFMVKLTCSKVHFLKKLLTISRSGQPLFLNQERYDSMVRTPLLKLGIETQIVRRMDRILDPGVSNLVVVCSDVRDGRLFD